MTSSKTTRRHRKPHADITTPRGVITTLREVVFLGNTFFSYENERNEGVAFY
jgi:hypothetical protein